MLVHAQDFTIPNLRGDIRTENTIHIGVREATEGGTIRPQRVLLVMRVICIWLAVMYGCKEFVTPPPDDGSQKVINRILFTSNRETPNSRQIFSMNPDGSDIRRITYPADSITFLWAAWSPDHRQIAVVWNYHDLRRREFPALAIADTNGNYLFSIGDYCAPVRPVWSPDGDKLAFTRPATYFGGKYEIYVANILTSEITKVLTFQDTGSVTHSSSVMDWLIGDTLLVNVRTDSTHTGGRVIRTEVYELNLQDKALRRILGASDSNYFATRLSPDRARIAYLYSDRNGHFGVAISRIDGTSSVKVAPELNYYYSEGEYQGLCWSPGGSQLSFSAILYRHYQPPFGAIYVVNSDGTGFKTIISDSTTYNVISDWK